MADDPQKRRKVQDVVQRATGLNAINLAIESRKAAAKRKAADKHIEVNDNRLSAIMEVILDLDPQAKHNTIDSAATRAQTALTAQRRLIERVRNTYVARFLGQDLPDHIGLEELHPDAAPRDFSDLLERVEQSLSEFRFQHGGYRALAPALTCIDTTMTELNDIRKKYCENSKAPMEALWTYELSERYGADVARLEYDMQLRRHHALEQLQADGRMPPGHKLPLDQSVSYLRSLDPTKSADRQEIHRIHGEAEKMLNHEQTVFLEELQARTAAGEECCNVQDLGLPLSDTKEASYAGFLAAIKSQLEGLKLHCDGVTSLGNVSADLVAATKSLDRVIAVTGGERKEIEQAKWMYQLALKYKAATADLERKSKETEGWAGDQA